MKSNPILLLLMLITLGTASCSQEDSVENETELFSPGEEEEVDEERGGN